MIMKDGSLYVNDKDTHTKIIDQIADFASSITKSKTLDKLDDAHLYPGDTLHLSVSFVVVIPIGEETSDGSCVDLPRSEEDDWLMRKLINMKGLRSGEGGTA